MKIKSIFWAVLLLVFTLTSCKNDKKQEAKEGATMEETQENANEQVVYEVDLSALNSEVTGSETTGKASFTVSENTMKVVIDVKNAPADMEHWQHFHGFVNGDEASCAQEDKNEDGIIDVTETEDASGTTMIPFNEIPTDIDLGDSTYPIADKEGNYHYETSIKIDDLNEAFAKAFDGQDVNLDTRVLYIHGVPKDTDLPESVKSIEDIPAQVTLPIACGKIVKVNP